MIDETFKETSITEIESIVREVSPQKDELINLENTITSLTEKIKQTKQVSDVDIEDNVKQFDVKTQNILPLASFVNVVRCSSITKEEILTLLLTSGDENESSERIMPETIPENKNISV